MQRGALARYEDNMPTRGNSKGKNSNSRPGRKTATLPVERPEPLPGEKPIDIARLADNRGISYRALMRYVGSNRESEPELWAEKFGQRWQTYLSWIRIWQKKLEAVPPKKPQAKGAHTR